ncbi:DNA-processing protein DprA [Butyrivibrio sp. AE3004]|uniref:DNA-processing protein DprA n=1 Tax=Butyrivibrio sp. AE3004 TaxID=1506994 RepID=UPI000493D273|nr:DNA-processing protein DprA [Butyrivibrio sp. AE3004]
MKENAYAYMLHNVPYWGNKTLFRLMEEFGSCKDIYNVKEETLAKYVTAKQLSMFLKQKKKWDVEAEYEYLYNRGIDFYPYFSEEYPARLKDIPDAPFALYCIGKLPDELKPSVSIIGARNSSEYGRYAARLFGEKLALAGIQIISGMARGIDGISQTAAINSGGLSFAVLGSGVDVCYPEENRMLYDALITQGGIISEYVPGTAPKPQFFPPRNRIISGLSDAVLVIEAREKSGTLITVDMALEQGREVFALPGRINDSLSYGCNSLIRQGAGIASSPEDIASYLRKELFKKLPKLNEDNRNFKTGECEEMLSMSEKQKIIYRVLDFYPQTSSVIFEKVVASGMEMNVSEVMNGLVELCISGFVSQNGTGFYKKVS